MEPNKTEIKRNSDGTFADGTAPGPGRKKGKTLKEYAREYFELKTDEEKKGYIEDLETKKPGYTWAMAEGNPANNTDITSRGDKIVFLPSEIADKNDIKTNESSPEAERGSEEQQEV